MESLLSPVAGPADAHPHNMFPLDGEKEVLMHSSALLSVYVGRDIIENLTAELPPFCLPGTNVVACFHVDGRSWESSGLLSKEEALKLAEVVAQTQRPEDHLTEI